MRGRGWAAQDHSGPAVAMMDGRTDGRDAAGADGTYEMGKVDDMVESKAMTGIEATAVQGAAVGVAAAIAAARNAAASGPAGAAAEPDWEGVEESAKRIAHAFFGNPVPTADKAIFDYVHDLRESGGGATSGFVEVVARMEEHNALEAAELERRSDVHAEMTSPDRISLHRVSKSTNAICGLLREWAKSDYDHQRKWACVKRPTYEEAYAEAHGSLVGLGMIREDGQWDETYEPALHDVRIEDPVITIERRIGLIEDETADEGEDAVADVATDEPQDPQVPLSDSLPVGFAVIGFGMDEPAIDDADDGEVRGNHARAKMHTSRSDVAGGAGVQTSPIALSDLPMPDAPCDGAAASAGDGDPILSGGDMQDVVDGVVDVAAGRESEQGECEDERSIASYETQDMDASEQVADDELLDDADERTLADAAHAQQGLSFSDGEKSVINRAAAKRIEKEIRHEAEQRRAAIAAWLGADGPEDGTD